MDDVLGGQAAWENVDTTEGRAVGHTALVMLASCCSTCVIKGYMRSLQSSPYHVFQVGKINRSVSDCIPNLIMTHEIQ